MSALDWIVLATTLLGVLCYGLYRGRGQASVSSYMRVDKNVSWVTVLIGVMATQASAITFLSGPGQAYADGMRFIQYYFGLPIAMVVICVTFIPMFRKQNCYTAYEFLEKRFDKKTRIYTAFLFLLSRGLSTGVSIYLPSIVLSTLFGWNIYLANLLVGGLLIIYTFRGGARSIAYTQKFQFAIIMGTMFVAGILIVVNMPQGIGFTDALYIAGKSGKLNVITTEFNINDKYNIWSGIIGGFFLALSYFGTDQSQVGRYLIGEGHRSSKLGLLMNGIVKIPMQFGILLLGALLVVFYSTRTAPIFFDTTVVEDVRSARPHEMANLDVKWKSASEELTSSTTELVHKRTSAATYVQEAQFSYASKRVDSLRKEFKKLAKDVKNVDVSDTNYVFLNYVLTYLPHGLIGLLLAIVFLASWGSISAALHSLASSSLFDLHLALKSNGGEVVHDAKTVRNARLHTLAWGLFCIVISMYATMLGSLIEAVNVLGSLFYGTILGVFLVAFYVRKANGRDTLYAAILAQVMIIACYIFNAVGFLWFNLIGAVLVVGTAYAMATIRELRANAIR